MLFYPAQDFLSFSISFPSKEELEKLAFFQYRTVSKENISFAFILERVFENETRKAFRNLRRYAFCLRHLALLSEIRYSVLLALLEESSKKCRHYEKEADYSISAGKERFFRTVQAIAQREVSVLMNELSKRGSL